MTLVIGEADSEPRRVRFYKLVTRGESVLELCFSVLYHYRDEFTVEIDETFTNFQAK